MSSVEAQDPSYPMGLSVKTLFMDYHSQNGGDITEFKSYHHGFEFGFHKNIQPTINLVVPIKIGQVTSHNGIENYHKTIFGVDVQLQYQVFKPDTRVTPYLFGGVGAVSETEGEFNIQAPLGGGLSFKIGRATFFNLQSEYRISFGEDRNNLHHGIGFIYMFGKGEGAEEKPVEEETSLVELADSDGDGIADELDLCPQAAGSKALSGCPDRDEDGVADFEDKCPDYPGLKVFKGCPDSDGDGVSDNDDECPNMAGTVSNNGCPDNDSDNDGIPNDLDKCPDVKGSAANDGCPSSDSDGDGIADADDKCPNRKGSLATDGCPDRDSDGIADYQDKCPDKFGPKVYDGCPDTDGDGIDDSRDRCPETAGPVDTNGCPEIAAEDQRILNTAMRSVQFDIGKATLKGDSRRVLNKIGDILTRYPDFVLSIEGHTDNTGSAVENQKLSERRAKTCYEYLNSIGIPMSRMNYIGYGESRAIADNSSVKGRSLNRRTEFILRPR